MYNNVVRVDYRPRVLRLFHAIFSKPASYNFGKLGKGESEQIIYGR